jgi:hypothetical protein
VISHGVLVRLGAAEGKSVWAHLADWGVTGDRLRLGLAATLLVGAGAHVLVGAQHSSSTFGTLAMLSGVIQFGLAVAVMLRPSRTAYRLAVIVSLVLVELYLLNVTVGLPPLVAHTHSTGTHQILGLTLAWPAPVDGEGIVAKSAELIAVVFGGLLGRPR